MELRRGDEVRVEAGRYPFPTVVGEGGTGGEWFESVRRALRWNTRGAVQRSFGGKEPNVSRRGGGRLADDIVDEEDGEEEDIDEGNEQEEEGEEEWDIDVDPIESLSAAGTLDSGLGASEEGSSCASPPGPVARIDNETVD